MLNWEKGNKNQDVIQELRSIYGRHIKLNRGRTQQSLGKDPGNVKRGVGEVSARRQEQGDVSGDSGKRKQHIENGFLEDDKGNYMETYFGYTQEELEKFNKEIMPEIDKMPPGEKGKYIKEHEEIRRMLMASIEMYKDKTLPMTD